MASPTSEPHCDVLADIAQAGLPPLERADEVREAWVRWVRVQPYPKPHWLASYDALSEVGRYCLGETADCGCFFLPPYSPDRNPDELVWKHLKADTVGRMTMTRPTLGSKN